MATSRMARRNLAQQQLKVKQEASKTATITSGLQEIGGMLQLYGEATKPMRSAWKDFEAGQKELGIDSPMKPEGNFLQKLAGGAKDMFNKQFRMPENVHDGRTFFSDKSGKEMSYTGDDIQFAGRIATSKNPLVRQTLAAAQDGGKSFSEALGIGDEITGGMSESDMEFKAKLSAQRRGGSGRYGKFGAKPSISSMDSGTGVLSQLAGVESSLTGGNMMMDSSTAFDLPEPKLNEVSREAIKQVATGPQGQRLEHHSKTGDLFYYIDPSDKSKGSELVMPGTEMWTKLGLDKLQEMQTDNKGMK